MDILRVTEMFSTQEDCLRFLETLRWGEEPCCIHCGGIKVGRKNKNDIKDGWNCYDCGSTFSIIAGTMFHKTRIPLRKWFLAISIILNSKKSISSTALARHLDMNQKSAWYMEMRIRAQMIDDDTLLKGIVEADETYVGGKPRYRKGKTEKSKRGRGTKKAPVVGLVQRGGKVVAQYMVNVGGAYLRHFILKHVKHDETILMTDEFKSYKSIEDCMEHHTINHGEKKYVDGDIYTNTIEGFWSEVKRAFHGTHHWYSKKWLPLYIQESCFKRNHRHDKDLFMDFMKLCVA